MADVTMVRYLIGASRVKFDVLSKLYLSNVGNIGQYCMNVMYVDANSIFYRLFQQAELETLYADNENAMIRDITVSFLNILGHYRRFFSTRLGMDNDIYVFFNPDPAKYNTELVKEYGKPVYGRYDVDDPYHGEMAKAVRRAWSYIQSLSPYFEGIYCLPCSGVDEFAMMARCGFEDDIMYTIFSRNEYGYQFLRDNVVQLNNRRDQSKLVTKDNCYIHLMAKNKVVPSKKLTPDMLPLIWTLSGCRGTGVNRVKYVSGQARMVRVASRMAENGDLVSGMSIQSFLEVLPNYLKGQRIPLHIDAEYLMRRYRVMNAELAGKAITQDQWMKAKTAFSDLFDQTAMERINDILATKSSDPNLLDLTNLNMSEGTRYEY